MLCHRYDMHGVLLDSASVPALSYRSDGNVVCDSLLLLTHLVVDVIHGNSDVAS